MRCISDYYTEDGDGWRCRRAIRIHFSVVDESVLNAKFLHDKIRRDNATRPTCTGNLLIELNMTCMSS